MSALLTEFWTSPLAQQHMLEKHNISFEEAEHAAAEAPVYTRQSMGRGEPRYLAAGKTAAGRRLWVIFADEGQGRGRIITAREPHGRKELTWHRQHRNE